MMLLTLLMATGELCLVDSNHRVILLLIILFNIVDVIVNCICEKMVNGLIERYLKKSFLMYAKSWLIPDIMFCAVVIFIYSDDYICHIW